MRAEQESTSNPVSTGDGAYFDKEVGWLRADARKSRWFTFAILCFLILDVIVIGALATGPINVFHNDALLLLDDGWRVLNGQVPHQDFHTPLGPVEFFVVAAGMKLAAGSAQGIAIGIAGFGLALGAWSWLLCCKRMPPVLATLATAWIVLTATCPTPLGFDPRFLSCAMIYNRQGYALLGIILIECAFARERSRFWGGFSSGFAAALLIFLKLNFFGFAALLLVATVPLRRAEFSRMWGLLAGAAAPFVGFLLYPRFSLSAFFTDMAFVAHARESSLNVRGLVHGAAICARSGSFWLVIVMAVGVVVLASPGERRQGRVITIVLLTLIVLASGPLFLQTNSLENRCQLASLWIIVLLDPISALHLRLAKKMVTLVITAACLGGIAAALVPEVSSTLSLLSNNASRQKDGISIAAPGMEKMRFYDSTGFYDKVKFGDGDGSYYADTLRDGMRLLSSQSRPNETILALGFHNPFSYLLRRKPAPGGSSYLFVGNSISENHMPPSEWVFDDADLMLLPQNEGTHHDSDQFIQSYYGDYLTQNFHFVAKSRYWSLYRRNR